MDWMLDHMVVFTAFTEPYNSMLGECRSQWLKGTQYGILMNDIIRYANPVSWSLRRGVKRLKPKHVLVLPFSCQTRPRPTSDTLSTTGRRAAIQSAHDNRELCLPYLLE